jgi:hypothetical protein
MLVKHLFKAIAGDITRDILHNNEVLQWWGRTGFKCIYKIWALQ